MVSLVKHILSVFAKHGLFDEGVALVGSWCFQLYQKHFHVEKFPLQTQDIDFLIPNPFKGGDHKGFIEDLVREGFTVDHHADGSLYLWNADLKIEFLTPDKGAGIKGSLKVKQLALAATPLRLVNLLLDHPVKVTEGDISVLIPHPANYCLHKLLIVDRRKNLAKAEKDLRQAVLTGVKVKPQKLKAVFQSLPKTWQKDIGDMLGKAKRRLPHLEEELRQLESTLQMKG